MCAESSAVVSAAGESACCRSWVRKSEGTPASSAQASASGIGCDRLAIASGAVSMKIALACSGRAPAAIRSTSWPCAIRTYSAGAERVASTT